MTFIEFPKVNMLIQQNEDIKFPKMMKIRQKYDESKIEDIPSWIRKEMNNNLEGRDSYKGKRICITAGSRGIPYLDVIIRAIAEQLKEWGAQPFVIPAMGSHGGATAEGQREVIAGYNVTEETVGIPIISSMDVVKIAELKDGTPIYLDKNAYESDGIVVLNKVKPHTDFRGKHESGLGKMMAIGLAKHKGAAAFHRMGFCTFAERIPEVCDVFIDKAPVAFGVGIVQNAYDEISELEIIPKEKILERDAALLEIAKEKIAKFKFNSIDVLIIDEIGKHISGNGFDPNIVGRNNSGLPGFSDIIDMKKLFIRGLTRETHHNACGLACADITTRRCLNSVDFDATWVNIITSTQLTAGRIPMYMNNDRDALMLAISTCNNIDFNRARVVRIKNTLCMNEIEVSESYYEELKDRDDVDIISGLYDIEFDGEGDMI